ncbi:DUF1294 domain-containing protein [Silvimonas sp.]|uniref:DUF1294 domain-containing protein n=1 Tax=Silvimonas sp. TaxID=2650811 RepID=UPI002849F7C0|nr:DUF1294 domain-containing protein [Silvimonas sp.]MDR3429750.1 DUF1294 domain-containing protein [Silvimonas sp.]
MLKHGTLVIWQDAQGFGFIETPERARYFLHIKSIKRTGNGRPQVGDEVIFAPGKDAQGRPVASAATIGTSRPGRLPPARSRPVRSEKRPSWSWLDLLAVSGLLILGAVCLRWPHGMQLLQIMAALSGLSLVLYAIDKHQARRSGRRIAERTLQVLALAGGWPGAWLAQRLFNHKSVKTSFRLVFAIAVVLQVGSVVGMGLMPH